MREIEVECIESDKDYIKVWRYEDAPAYIRKKRKAETGSEDYVILIPASLKNIKHPILDLPTDYKYDIYTDINDVVYIRYREYKW